MMRKILIILTVIFVVLSILFTILPLGTIAFLPIGISFVLCFVTFQQSKLNQRVLPKILLVLSVLTFLVVIGKAVFVKDVIVKDQIFEQNKVEQKKEDIKDLEGLK
jgi:uncharacterized membrane protein